MIVKPGQFSNSALTSSGAVEPNQPCAIIGWNGRVDYRAGAWTQSWAFLSGTTYVATITSVTRVFRTDGLTPEGLYTELVLAPDLVTCSSAPSTWFKDGADGIHVNIGKLPEPTDIAVIRGFHGARLLTHVHDLYLENIHCQGGISGALHCEAIATRKIVGVNCSFRYSSPSTSAPVPLDAARCRSDQVHRWTRRLLRL